MGVRSLVKPVARRLTASSGRQIGVNTSSLPKVASRCRQQQPRRNSAFVRAGPLLMSVGCGCRLVGASGATRISIAEADRCVGGPLAFLISRTAAAMSTPKKPQVLFVLGGPGAGKGTICGKLVDTYGYVHLSAGDLLREERAKPGSQYGELIETHIRNGTIVPVEITCSLIDRAMKESKSPHNKFLIDGFPRNQDNLRGWTQEMSDKVELNGVLFFKCSEEVCTQRCINRGKQGSGRSDDNPDVLKKRHQTYVNDTMPIVEHYEKLGLVYSFDGEKTPTEVFENVQETLEKIGWCC